MFFKNFINYLTFSKNEVLKLESLTDDIIDFLTHYTNYSGLALNRFKWNFSKDYELIDSFYIEKILYYVGAIALVKTENRGFMLARFNTISKHFNYFQEPTKIQAFDYYTGESLGEYTEDNFVIIANNPLWYPTNVTVWNICAKLANLDRAVTINTFSQQTPILCQGDEKQKVALQNAAAQIEEGARYIFAPKDSPIKDITTLDIRAPFVAKDLLDVSDRLKASLLTLMGINNENVNKQSGVSPDEVNSNNSLVQFSSEVFVLSRQRAIAEIKRKFNIDVELVDNYAKDVKTESQTQEGGEE